MNTNEPKEMKKNQKSKARDEKEKKYNNMGFHKKTAICPSKELQLALLSRILCLSIATHSTMPPTKTFGKCKFFW
jgi:hypothetical protein